MKVEKTIIFIVISSWILSSLIDYEHYGKAAGFALLMILFYIQNLIDVYK